jgi:hypothetical protein
VYPAVIGEQHSGASLKIYRKFRPVERVDAGVEEIVRRYSAFIAVGESDARPAFMGAGHGGLASRTLKTPGETVSSTKLNEQLLNFRMRRPPSPMRSNARG